MDMEQPEDALSTYRSIIPEDGDQWIQLPKSHYLSQLHRKFWGVSMKDEETKWRQAQPPEPMDVDVDNQDSEEHEKVEDDIGPGSYILTLDVPNMQVSLWVRQEYIRVYNYCEDYLKAYKPSTLAPSVVITGQPGIGEYRASRPHSRPHCDYLCRRRTDIGTIPLTHCLSRSTSM